MSRPEHALQRRIAEGLRARGLVFRPGLEGVLTRTQRIRAAQIGLAPGWPDIHLPAQRGRAAVWIELKAPGKRPTIEQWERMAWLEEQGDAVAWFDDAGRCLAWVDGLYR